MDRAAAAVYGQTRGRRRKRNVSRRAGDNQATLAAEHLHLQSEKFQSRESWLP